MKNSESHRYFKVHHLHPGRRTARLPLRYRHPTKYLQNSKGSQMDLSIQYQNLHHFSFLPSKFHAEYFMRLLVFSLNSLFQSMHCPFREERAGHFL
jgi:hypothetical protein